MTPPPLQTDGLISSLGASSSEFVIVGGVAAVLHGIDYNTSDLDVCAPLGQPNIRRIVSALSGLNPRQRMKPHLPPLPHDLAEWTGLNNLYVQTTLGWIDFLGDVPGVGSYERVVSRAITMRIAGLDCKVICLDDLITAKRTAGRLKDRLVLPSLLAIQQLQAQDSDSQK